MSIPVEVGDLAKALQDFGTGYLLTAAVDGHDLRVTPTGAVLHRPVS